MNNEQRKETYLRFKSDVLTIHDELDSLSTDYRNLTNQLNTALKIDNNIINAQDWSLIGYNQDLVLNDIEQKVLPTVENNINN